MLLDGVQDIPIQLFRLYEYVSSGRMCLDRLSGFISGVSRRWATPRWTARAGCWSTSHLMFGCQVIFPPRCQSHPNCESCTGFLPNPNSCSIPEVGYRPSQRVFLARHAILS